MAKGHRQSEGILAAIVEELRRFEKRAALLTQLSSLDDEITRALFAWQRFQTEEAYQNEVAAQNAWKEEANKRAPLCSTRIALGMV